MSSNIVTDDVIKQAIRLMPEEHMRFFYENLGGKKGKFNVKKFPDFALTAVSQILSDGVCKHSNTIIQLKTQRITELVQTGGALTVRQRGWMIRIIGAIVFVFALSQILRLYTDYSGEIKFENAKYLCVQNEYDTKLKDLKDSDMYTIVDAENIFDGFFKVFTYAWKNAKEHIPLFKNFYTNKELRFDFIENRRDSCINTAKTDYTFFRSERMLEFAFVSILTTFAVNALKAIIHGSVDINPIASAADLSNDGMKLARWVARFCINKPNQESESLTPEMIPLLPSPPSTNTETQKKPEQKPEQNKPDRKKKR